MASKTGGNPYTPPPAEHTADRSASEAPYPGSRMMPQWEVGKLHDAPLFTWKSWTLLIGPGLVMGASAIGGGEWLTGPLVTARYGATLFWLATISIVSQTLYNIEICRYTLYSGEPIFTGKFRTLPGPIFWLIIYIFLDFGSVLPYLASNAAIPLAAILLGHLPDPAKDAFLIKSLGCGIFVFALTPVFLGGKIYNWLKALMTFKLIYVVGFLVFLAIFFSSLSTWKELALGFVTFGNVPVIAPEGAPPEANVANVFTTLWNGGSLSQLSIDFSMFGILAAMAAISGNGGLTNTPLSNYTRDQGWGMGREVGAIPSIVGRHEIELSHVGKVFHVTQESLKKWFGWMRHLQREQFIVWMPACFLGLALPSMLSMVFLPRGTVLKDQWLAAGMTADGVANAIAGRFGESLGPVFWYLTLFCGFMILATAMSMTADGCLRRWVDVSWTAVPALRKLDNRHIGRFYFAAMCFYLLFGLVMLTQINGTNLLVFSTMMYNYALGVSCWHALAVNTILLPRELRPSYWRRTALFLAGIFFIAIAVLTTMDKLGVFKTKEPPKTAQVLSANSCGVRLA